MDWRKIVNQTSKQWFSFQNSGETAVIRIDGVIGGDWYGDGVTAKQFANEFNAISASDIELHINSPGGSVFDGFAIYNLLKSSGKKIKVCIDGVAASIASVIAMAGDEITIPENAFLMIHNPWMLSIGNAKQLRSDAGTLDGLGEQIAKIYIDRSGADASEIAAIIEGNTGDGTFLSAERCLELGLATEVVENKKAAACSGIDIFGAIPEPLAKMNDAARKRDLESALRDAGYSAAKAKQIASGPVRDAGEETGSWRDVMELWKNEINRKG